MHAHCYRADEILMLIRLAEEMGFKIATFQHVLEGYKVANEIAAHGAGASTFSDWWGYKIEAEDAIPHNAAIMTRKGVLVSINSDSAEHARRLNTEAAKSIKWGGLTEDEALALVTINPGEAAADRQPRRLARSRQGRRRRHLERTIRSAPTRSSIASTSTATLYYDRLAEERRLTDAAQGEDRSGRRRSAGAPPTANDPSRAEDAATQTRNGRRPNDEATEDRTARAPRRRRPERSGGAAAPQAQGAGRRGACRAITNARIIR